MRPLRMVWLSSQVSGVCGATITTSSSGFSLQALRQRLGDRHAGEELVLDVDRALGARDHVGNSASTSLTSSWSSYSGSVRAIATVDSR